MSERLIESAWRLRETVGKLRFTPPVAHVYNPLDYAWAPHEEYLRRYGKGRKRVLFLGMNPGPFGMVQTGIPFGEIAAVRDWLGIRAAIAPPALEHPKRRIEGFDCARSEVSGQRLWGLFAKRFGSAGKFFSDHMVGNYCPLAFLEASGCNRTPDKLPVTERDPLFAACDAHLRDIVAEQKPEWIIGVGDFAFKRAVQVFGTDKAPVKIGRILHPSPASPAANRDWAGMATAQLREIGIWE